MNEQIVSAGIDTDFTDTDFGVPVFESQCLELTTSGFYKIIVLRQSTLNLRWRSGRCWRVGFGRLAWQRECERAIRA
jgi:hypothetical protein